VSPAGTTPPSGGERSLLANWLSVAGAFLAALTFFAAAVLLVTNLLAPFRNPYMGIFLFVLAPAVVGLGLLLVALGAWRERHRRRRPGAAPLPRIDLNDPAQRRAAMVALAIAVLLLFVTAVGSYQAYDYSESVTFCGQVCHGPMHPELTAYRDAPHARVGCVACHVGPGASWFVRSKITGVHQLYAVLTGTYPRPIPTPIDNLRPAQQTCEECHWPAKFYGDVERVWHHYLSDEQNSPWTIRLLLKVGGGDPTHGPIGGIHWHMNLAEKVEYIAADAGREVIPWIRVTRRDGTVTVYQSTDAPLTPAQVAAATPRVMDCLDCHNRPAHDYLDPVRAVEIAMSTGRIDPRIPFVKKEAVAALTGTYATTDEAVGTIATRLTAYYADHHADFVAQHRPAIAAAIAEVQNIYRRNFFPEMRVDWKAYPSHIGHLTSPGCYRCHDGNHVSADGKAITHDCETCHLVLAQGPDAVPPPQPLPFQHPADIGDVWEQMSCNACHTGGPA
jgi:hypothetical protein